MFRFTQEPPSGSYNQSLAKITSLIQLCVSVQTLSVLWRHMLPDDASWVNRNIFGTTYSSNTTHTSSGQRNCASWASQPQKSVTLLPCLGGRTTKSTKGHVVALGRGGNRFYIIERISWTIKHLISLMHDVTMKIMSVFTT